MDLGICQSAGDSITKYHRFAGQDNRNLLLIVLETGKFKIKVPSFVSGENSSPGYLCAVSSHGWQEGRERVLLGVFLIRTQILSDQGSMLMNSFNLKYFSTGPISKYSHLGIRTSVYKFRGYINIQSISWGGGHNPAHSRHQSQAYSAKTAERKEKHKLIFLLAVQKQDNSSQNLTALSQVRDVCMCVCVCAYTKQAFPSRFAFIAAS